MPYLLAMTATMLTDRAVLRLAGDNVREFLQGLLTNDVTLLAPDAPQWTALLTPQGKVLFDMILWDDGTAILIDCEAAEAEALTRRLTLYRLRRAITIEPVAAAVHWSAGGPRGYADPRLPELGRRWIAAPGNATEDWVRHRLNLGVTEGRRELSQGETLWLECNAEELGGVSFTKGCYVGQENTARMHYRSTVNRRLVVTPLGETTARTRAVHPDLGVMIELRRIDALGDALRPGWLAKAFAAGQRPTAE